MNKETTEAYLEDIRPTELRLKQVEYLLSISVVEDDIRAVAWSEKVSTYTIVDTTGNSVARTLDRQTDLTTERDLLRAKLELYSCWLKNIEDEYDHDIIREIYREGHSVQWLAIERGEEYDTIRKRRGRLIDRLSKTEIHAMTERERGITKS